MAKSDSSDTNNTFAAEFAIRWDPNNSNISSVNEVKKLLKLDDDLKTSLYDICYFSAPPHMANKPYTTICRQRKKHNNNVYELTTKFRTQKLGVIHQASDFTPHLHSLPIPISAKFEVDISITGLSAMVVAHSLSYSRESVSAEDLNFGFDTEHTAEAIRQMKRYKFDDYKLEVWSTKGSAREIDLIEISHKGNANHADLLEFYARIATPLLDQGVEPMAANKAAITKN